MRSPLEQQIERPARLKDPALPPELIGWSLEQGSLLWVLPLTCSYSPPDLLLNSDAVARLNHRIRTFSGIDVFELVTG